jgi:hypothetical protein
MGQILTTLVTRKVCTMHQNYEHTIYYIIERKKVKQFPSVKH